MRDRLTYSNVVATLALFIALGGTGYAAATITSSDIKNRTIKGGDVKKNALGGTEINERKLRQVPNAARAATAGSADISKNAETANQATNATNATNAALANVARDANTLAGQGAASFEQNSVVQFGKAPVNAASSSAEQTVLSWPELGLAVTTANQGLCGGDLVVNFRNTRTSGPAIQMFQDGSAPDTANPGGTFPVCSNTGSNSLHVTVTDSTGRALLVDCVKGNDELRCFGIRSEP
jgi:hypothetical protein